MRKATSFTVDRAVLDYVRRTARGRSRSQRVNELLRRAIEQERQEALSAEAAAFFARVPPGERAEAKVWRALSARSWARE